MSNLKTPFRYDYVGSFLRPAKLKKARADYEAGTISAEQLKSVEDECIIQLVNKIKELGYHDGVADLLFGEENVNAYYLEFDDERSGGFEPLAKISGDKKVVLGLITTKKPDLENKKAIVERIKQAAQYVPLDRLYLSPQCGFASCEIGNKLTEEEQWAKLKLVKEIAEEVWK